jgi:hypothetical protein
MCSLQTMTNNTNTQPTRRAFVNEASTQPQLSQTILIVFSILHFIKSLNNYTELGEYFVTCQLLFKFKKQLNLNYNLSDYYSILYYNNEIFRARVLERIANPQKQLYLNLCMYNVSVTDFSFLGNVHNLNLSGSKIMDMCDHRIDLSALENVYSLNLSSCSFYDIIKINKIHTLHLADCFITNVSMLKDVCVLNLRNCYAIRDVSALRNVRYLCLRACRITDVSALENVDTLDLSFCEYITDVSPLRRVRVLDLSFCKKITHVGALDNVSVLNITYSNISCNAICKILKNIPTVVMCKDYGCPKYKEFRETYLGMFAS